MDSESTLHLKPSSKHRVSLENGISTDKRVGYNYEIKRVQSFESWPVHYPIDPARLAKSGFYYEGKDDEVTCFSCRGKIRDWRFGDVVQKKHAELYPECDFIKRQSNNIPATFSKINGVGKIRVKDNILFNNSRNPSAAAASGETSSHLIDRNTTSDETDCNAPNFEKMKSEEERLKTFSNRWPLSFIDVAELAKAGFFYLGFEDKVQCPFCKGTVKNWENGDVPLTEHAKHFPWCSHLQTVGYSSWISMQGTPWYKVTGYDTCGNFQTPDSPIKKSKLLDSGQSENLKKLGIHFYKGPAHPQQAPLTARLRSFLPWPSTALVTKEDLAVAGFFYIGLSDHTKCYHCGGGLCNWEKGDDPWFEHARWFPHCDFVRLTKGEEFIESCKEAHITTPSSASGKSDNAVQNTCPSNEIFMERVKEAMKSRLIEQIVESNIYPYDAVHKAVLQQIKQTGTSFSNVDEVCEAIAYLTERMDCEPIKVEEKAAPSTSVPQLNNVHAGSVLEDMSQAGVSSLYNCNTVEKKPAQNLEGSCLEEENKVLRDQCLCKVCMDKEVGIVFLPCGHLLTCTLCAPALKICPMCRKTIQATVRAYLP